MSVNFLEKGVRVANSEMNFFSRVFQGILCHTLGVFQGTLDYVFEKYNYPI